jgi:hypothetical protein
LSIATKKREKYDVAISTMYGMFPPLEGALIVLAA